MPFNSMSAVTIHSDFGAQENKIRQEYWCGLPFPSTEDLSDPGIEPACPVSPGDVSRRILYHSAAWLSLKTNYQTTSTFKETFYCWGIGEVS